jgi:hypothetical protein
MNKKQLLFALFILPGFCAINAAAQSNANNNQSLAKLG